MRLWEKKPTIFVDWVLALFIFKAIIVFRLCLTHIPVHKFFSILHLGNYDDLVLPASSHLSKER